jgi:beta-glucosidase
MEDAVRSAPYWNATRPVAERVQDLLGRMTRAEKLAQLGSVWAYQVLDGTVVKAEARDLLKDGIGAVTRVGGALGLAPGDTQRAARRLQEFLREETRLGIPALIHEETCAGYMAFGATAFAQPIGMASTWDPELVEETAAAIGKQVAAVGAHHALAPVLDVARDPRWGRTEETFGEDPYLVARMGTAYVAGLQRPTEQGTVIATGKHFAAYGASEGGLNWAPAHVPPRELAEVYLMPFEAAVKVAGLGSIMPAYHDLDGLPCHVNTGLLTTVLRREWGFDGIVVSDYFGVAMVHEYHGVAAGEPESAAMSLQAGLDIELPATNYFGKPLAEALARGLVPEAVLDEAVRRVLTVKMRLGLFDRPAGDPDAVTRVFQPGYAAETARRLARESLVLLKNRGRLPLSRTEGRIAVVGPGAHDPRLFFGDYSYPAHVQGLRAAGEAETFGAPVAAPDAATDELAGVMSVRDAIAEKVGADRVVYARGVDVLDLDRSGFPEAVRAVEGADVAIAVMGDRSGLTLDCTSGESRDRARLNLPGVQEDLLRDLVATGVPVILVLLSGRPVTFDDELWDSLEAVLEAWLPGQEGGRAIADVLFGDVNPSGRLPVSVPREVGQVPVYYRHLRSGGRSHWHKDYVDMPVEPRCAFGFGLSYTTFLYRDLAIAPMVWDPTAGPLSVTVTVTNTGSRAGTEVVQVYAGWDNTSVTRPVRQLVAFARVALEPGESRTVAATVFPEQLAFLNREMRWVVEPGTLRIEVGASSADIREQATVSVTRGGPVERRRFFADVAVR